MLKGTPKHNPINTTATLWHLLIGVNQTPVQQTLLEPLKYAASDCQQIADIFEQLKPISPGEKYEAIILHDGSLNDRSYSKIRKKRSISSPTKQNIEESLERIISNAQPSDRILVYITGHAICDSHYNPYLIVADTQVKPQADAKVEAEIDLNTAIALNDLIDRLGHTKVKEVVLLLDTCNSGLVDLPDFKIAKEPELFYILSSSWSSQSSYQLDGLKHSLFSYYLIKALCAEVKNENQETTTSALFNYLTNAIPLHLEHLKEQSRLSLATQGKTNVVEDIKQQPTQKISGTKSDTPIARGVIKSFIPPTQALIVSDHQSLKNKLVNLLKTTTNLEVIHPDLASYKSIAIQKFFQGEGTRILYYRGKLEKLSSAKIERKLAHNPKIKPILLIEAIPQGLPFGQHDSTEVDINNYLEVLKSASIHLENGLAFICYQNSQPDNSIFITAISAILEAAQQQNKGLTVATLISELQSNLGNNNTLKNPLKLWLSGERGILEIIPTSWQNQPVSNIYNQSTTWRNVAKKMVPIWLTTNLIRNIPKFNVDDIYVSLNLAQRLEIEKVSTTDMAEKDSACFPYGVVEGIEKYTNEEFCTAVIGEGKSPSKGKRIAIIGEPGSGKTTCVQQIAQWIETHTSAIPIWISLPDLQNHTISDYLENIWLREAYTPVDVTEEMKAGFLEQFLQQNVYLILDSLDEAVRNNPNLLITLEKELNNRYSNIKVVLSVRSSFWDNCNNLWEFDSYKIMPFDEAQIAEFIDKYFADLPEKDANLKTTLNKPENIYLYDLVKNPLRLMLLCNTWRLRSGKLPKTQAGLYKVFCNGFYDFQAEEIDQATQIKLHQALAKCALWALNNPQVGFRVAAAQIPPELTKEIGYYDQEKSLLWWALKLGWVHIVGVNEDNPEELIYAFVHPTFQEYFAANYIDSWSYFLHHNNDYPDPFKTYLGKPQTYRIFNPKWRQTLIFWLGREEIDLQHKQEFINELLKFKDGCHEDNWYEVRAALIAAGVWQILKKLSTPEEDKNLKNLSKKIQSRLSSFTNMTSYIIEAIAFYNINSDPASEYLKTKQRENDTQIQDLATIALKRLEEGSSNSNMLRTQDKVKHDNSEFKKFDSSEAINLLVRLATQDNEKLRHYAILALKDKLNSEEASRKEFIKIAKNKVEELYGLIWLCLQKMEYGDFYQAWHQ